MTQFIGVSEMARLVRKVGIEDFLIGLAATIEDDFRRWPVFDKSARVASHSPIGVIELMPASDGDLYAFKYVNGHPGNTRTGKLTVTAFGVLADVATGYPILVSEMTLLTALRTAATSAMAAKALARPDSTVMAMIGAGAQSEFQTFAFKAVLGIEEVRIYDPDPAAVAKFERNAAGFGLRIVRAEAVAEAVAGADIVTTATAVKGRAAVITPEMLSPGTHINAIGGDCPGKTELHPGVLDMGRVFVEYPPQTRVEGEIQQVAPDFAVTELWQVLAGETAGRRSRGEITIFDSVGFAIEDFSALRFVRDLTIGRRTDLELVPEIGNPKDLYGALLHEAPVRPRQREAVHATI
jgi:ornithine cyclodeaminase